MKDAPFRYLSRHDVIAAGGGAPDAAVNDVVAVLGLLRAGDAVMPVESSLPLDGSAQARVYALPARVGGAYGAAGLKWTAHRAPAADGAPQILSLTMVNDGATGRPLGIVESALLTATRTAAVSALALRTAAPGPLRRVTLLGAGAQARGHLRMLAALFPGLEAVTLWNRTPTALDRLLAIATPWPIHAEPDLRAALEDADAVIACTGAAEPFLGRGTVRPGRIVLQAGYHEVTFDAIDDADTVVVDLWGEFRRVSAKSIFQMHRAGRFEETRLSADLAAAVFDGWRPRPGAAVYFSSFGLNVFDVALAARVLRRAQELGIGTPLSLAGGDDWPEEAP